MLGELTIVAIAVAAVAGVCISERFERRRFRRHIAGREPLSAHELASLYFQSHEARVAERMIEVLGRHLAIDLACLRPDDRLVADLRMDALDSLSTVEFVLDIEEEFGVKIPDRVAEQILTFRQVVEYVASGVEPSLPAEVSASGRSDQQQGGG